MTSKPTARIPIISRNKLFKDSGEIWYSLQYNHWDTIYNKLRLIQAQGLECAPVGKTFIPQKFPVILKPIISISKAQQKYRVCMNEFDYQQLVNKGEYVGWFWMPYLDTEQQRCIELIIHNGRPIFGYSLDYHANSEMDGALSHISLNTTHKVATLPIPGWSEVLAPRLKGYTGALSLYYIGQYIISASARWTIWSEYIWDSTQFKEVLDRICRLLNTYIPAGVINTIQSHDSPDVIGVCHDLLLQAIGIQIISVIPLYLKLADNLPIARKHWQTICNSLGVPIYWQSEEPRSDEFMPLIATITVISTEYLKKINKYKQISQLSPVGQDIPVVY
jgi:hypothetical protein